MRNKKKFRVSVALKQSIKEFSEETGMSHYLIAAQAKIPPCTLSYMLTDTMLFLPEDPRIARIAKIVGFEGECLEMVGDNYDL